MNKLVRKMALLLLKISIIVTISCSVLGMYWMGFQQAASLSNPFADDSAAAIDSMQEWRKRNIVPYRRENWTLSGSVTAARALQMPPLNYRVIRLADTLVTSPSTVVTGYFITESKFSSDDYYIWMSNMLSTLDPMVVFTEASMVEIIQKYRSHALNATVIVEMTLSDMPITQISSKRIPNPQIFWMNQLEIDPEKKRHRSYELFWIWLSKSWWVNHAIDLNFFQSDFFMYSDIGCYRYPQYNHRRIVRHPELVPEGAILWMAHREINPPPSVPWNKKLDKVESKHFYQSGSQGAGTSQAWIEFHRVFADTIDWFIERDMFIGEDQTVLESACLIEPRLCAYVPHNQVRDNVYFGLRYVLHSGGDYSFWRPPNGTKFEPRSPESTRFTSSF